MGKTCYLGKETEECCKQRVKTAVRNTIYVFALIIGVAALVLSLTIKCASNEVFVDQFSFASTITSIILSVVAIWMSITGERNTSEIKEKVSSSVEKLEKNTSESQQLVSQFQGIVKEQNQNNEILEQRLEGIKEIISNGLDTIGNSVERLETNFIYKASDEVKETDHAQNIGDSTNFEMFAEQMPGKSQLADKTQMVDESQIIDKSQLVDNLLASFQEDSVRKIFQRSMSVYKDSAQDTIPVNKMLKFYQGNGMEKSLALMCIGFLWFLDCNDLL